MGITSVDESHASRWRGAAGTSAADLAAQPRAPGGRVALCLGRSPELVVALLGILKTGAAYMPLDPDYPAERLAFGRVLQQRIVSQRAVGRAAGPVAVVGLGPGAPWPRLAEPKRALG